MAHKSILLMKKEVNILMNKNESPLVICCGIVSLVTVIVIGVTTFNILQHMRSNIISEQQSYVSFLKKDEIPDDIKKHTSEVVDEVKKEETPTKTPEVETESGQHSDDNESHISNTYFVQEGDTLCYVSTLTGYSVDEIAKLNHIEDINLIYAGSVLKLPDK